MALCAARRPNNSSSMFRLSTQPIEPANLARALHDPRAGACATFEGWVRNRNEGQEVQALEYEAYAPLADKEGALILAEVRGKFPILGALCVHRVGFAGAGGSRRLGWSDGGTSGRGL